MKIYLQDRAFSHIPDGYTCNNPLPPVQVQNYIEWDRSRDYGNNEYVLYTDRAAKELDSTSRSRQYNLLWLIESLDLLHYYDTFPDLNKFERIYTHDRQILDTYSNSIPVTFGGTWIQVQDRLLHSKTKLVSMIASTKRDLPGHKLRGLVLDQHRSRIDCYGRGMCYIDCKITGMGPYMFHIAIENVKRDYYFTEKLIDCFLTGCVPIYWGCPSIGNFFDTRGMIVVDNIHDINKYLQYITPELYNTMLPHIYTNYHKAHAHIAPERFIYNDLSR